MQACGYKPTLHLFVGIKMKSIDKTESIIASLLIVSLSISIRYYAFFPFFLRMAIVNLREYKVSIIFISSPTIFFL
jgi:hypothetical protein